MRREMNEQELYFAYNGVFGGGGGGGVFKYKKVYH